ncbi:MAG: hypothetical protein ABIO57_02980 [Candidatus Paceibacterota bacterium]
MSIFHSTVEHIRGFLSHYPKVYALLAGIGVVLFWRGVWNSVDIIHLAFDHYQTYSTLNSAPIIWWDGPLSFVVGSIILYFTGAFVSSFIGNELILSGLRGEKKLNQKTETEVKTESTSIAEIKDELAQITQKLEELEIQISNEE